MKKKKQLSNKQLDTLQYLLEHSETLANSIKDGFLAGVSSDRRLKNTSVGPYATTDLVQKLKQEKVVDPFMAQIVETIHGIAEQVEMHREIMFNIYLKLQSADSQKTQATIRDDKDLD